MHGSRKGVWIIGSALITALLVGAVMAVPGAASPGSGATSVLQAQGAVTTTGAIPLLPGTNVVVVQNTFAPGGYSGWHSHPGPAVIVVVSGEITLHVQHGSNCTVTTYHAGDVFVERPNNSQNGINEGSTPAVLEVSFYDVPSGGAPRIERDDPGSC